MAVEAKDSKEAVRRTARNGLMLCPTSSPAPQSKAGGGGLSQAGSVGTPLLVLSTNNEKGIMEANVVFESPASAGLLQVCGPLQNLHALAQANLIAATQETIARQFSVEKTEGSGQGSPSSPQPTQDSKMAEKEKPKQAVTSESKQQVLSAVSASRDLECPFEGCGRKFSWPSHLKYHQLTHTGTRAFVCEVEGCKKKFYTAQRLGVHMRTHTGERPFSCTEPGCGKSFTTAGNLRNHTRIHTGERPYACEHEGCGRRFAEVSSLHKHKLTHTGEKPYWCEICGKSFSQIGTCRVHIKRHNMVKAQTKKRLERVLTPASPPQPSPQVCQSNHEVTQLQDLQAVETVVFTQGLSEPVVTVTTQPAEGPGEQTTVLAAAQTMMETDEVLSVDEYPGAGANVVVLSQPQDIVGLGGGYSQGGEEVVYVCGGDLLAGGLDHEEVAQSGLSLTVEGGEVGGAGALMAPSQTVLAGDQGLAGHTALSSTSAQPDRHITMDPMMESDEDSDVSQKQLSSGS